MVARSSLGSKTKITAKSISCVITVCLKFNQMMQQGINRIAASGDAAKWSKAAAPMIAARHWKFEFSPLRQIV